MSPAMTLVFTAKDKGFFLEQGLEVEIKEFTAGKFALQAFLGGSLDFAVSGEVPVCLASLQGNRLRVITQVVESTVNEVRVVALKDDDVTDPTQYFKRKKRKIATSFGGGPEFFTYSFLRHHQIDKDEIEVVSQRPEDMPAALATRSVDAISIFDPFAYVAEKQMAGQIITFANPTLYSELYVLAARPDQIEKNPALINAVVRALVQASTFIEEHPEEAKEILRRHTRLDRDVIDGIWTNFFFKPVLTHKLIDYWAAESIWARDVGKITPDTKIPDFRTIIDDRFLKNIKPEAVKL
jgi:NitT/TauT family transport system substrate-binding protein